jgi:succinyl-CoA synthetase alpha subunit
MSILIDENTNVIVQGVTGRDGAFHARQMVADGTKVVAGVTPKRGGQKVDEIPVFNSISEVKAEHPVDATVIFVPEKFATAAVEEAISERVPLIVWITEGVPAMDMLRVYHDVREAGLTLIGPNCPGLISPGKSKIGIMPARIHKPGGVGVISRSGTLTYEVVYNLTTNGLGQSTCVGIGGDPVVGSSFIDMLERFETDPETKAVVVIGEIGGEAEEAAADFIKTSMSKPVVGFISGRTAPPGKRMGHAGAIISGGKGTPDAKVKAFNEAGVPVADTPDQIPGLLKEKLGL